MTALIKFPKKIEEENTVLIRIEGELGHHSRTLDTICCGYRRVDLHGYVVDSYVTVRAKDLA